MCVLDVIGAPSIFRLTRKDAALARVLSTITLNCEDKRLKTIKTCVYLQLNKKDESRGYKNVTLETIMSTKADKTVK